MNKKLYILVPDNSYQIQAESASAASTISQVIRTCLGPRAMQKMVITKMNSIEVTNDGNSILREIDVSHPSARSIIELARTQEDEVGDGTTSVVVLASEMLKEMVSVLGKKVHPVVISKYMRKYLDIYLKVLDEMSIEVKEDQILSIVKSSINTKLCTILKIPLAEMALQAAKVQKDKVQVLKIVGTNSHTLDGVILNKDIIHPQMRKRIENPRVLILDTPLEYKKGESSTTYEFKGEMDFTRALEMEERQVREMVEKIKEVDIVICEKGISDLAMALLVEKNITAIRRVKKTDSTRLSKATGAVVVNRLEDLEEKFVGSCGLFEYVKYGEEYYCRFTGCVGSCSVVLGGPSKDILNELERNLNDAMKVARNVLGNPRLVPGGGCIEMNIYNELSSVQEVSENEKFVIEALKSSVRIIPSILLKNSGVYNPHNQLLLLEEEVKRNKFSGVDGVTGDIVDVRSVILEPITIKRQAFVSAFQSVIQLLRVDGILESRK